MLTAVRRVSLVLLVASLCALSGTAIPADGDPVTVTGTVTLVGKSAAAADARDVVVWLKPVLATGAAPSALAVARQKPRMIQRNKVFEPGLLVVPVGSSVEFPNMDPFFHNVFSMFDGKRFDLGLYETGASRSVTLSTTGVCYVFCNIHPEMSAVIVVIDTPYYAVSNRAGELSIPNVPSGRYLLSLWHQRHKPERPSDFPREITISATAASVGPIRLVESNDVIVPHKNKYGRDYNPPPATSPLYKKP